jgi:hypothetical protein
MHNYHSVKGQDVDYRKSAKKLGDAQIPFTHERNRPLFTLDQEVNLTMQQNQFLINVPETTQNKQNLSSLNLQSNGDIYLIEDGKSSKNGSLEQRTNQLHTITSGEAKVIPAQGSLITLKRPSKTLKTSHGAVFTSNVT